MSFAFKTLALAAFLAPVAYGKNDWSKPCTSGACSYESGDGVNKAYSAMTIVGAAPESLHLLSFYLPEWRGNIHWRRYAPRRVEYYGL